MSLPLNTQGIDNIMRLANLKNVDGRRRVKNNPPLLPEEEVNMDVKGVSQPPIMPKNIPEADLGGELTPQSYDVRANEVVDPNQPPSQEMPEEEKGFFRRLGESLFNYTSKEPVSESTLGVQQPIKESVSPTLESQGATLETPQEDSLLSKLGRYLGFNEPEKPSLTPEQEWQANLDKYSQGYIPEPKPYQVTPEPAFVNQGVDEAALNARIDEGQKSPRREAVYGSTDQFAKNPELVSNFQKYTGISFDEQTKEYTKKFEKVLSDLENNLNETGAGYDEQEARIRERILNNEATDADKFYIGLALLMPMILGGLFGKEVGVASLGGSFGGLSNAFTNRQKNILADEELLSGINKDRAELSLKKGELELERAKIPETVKKMMPEDEYADLKGMNIYQFTDPTTGQVVAEGPEILPGIYANLDVYNTSEKRKEAFKNAQEISKEKAALNTADNAMIKLIDVAYQLEDPTWFGNLLSYALAGDKEGLAKLYATKNAPEVYADGRKQNAAIYIDSLIEQIKDGYRRNEQMRAFTNTVAEHIGSMIRNPIYAGFKPRDLIDQVLLLRDRGMGFFNERVKAQGFLDAPVRSEFGVRSRAIYDAMNRAEERKQVPGLKMEAIKRAV